MQLTQEQIKLFSDQGFLFFPGLFTPPEIGTLNAELDTVLSGHGPENVREKGSDAVRTSFGVHMYNAAFARLARHPRGVDPAEPGVAGAAAPEHPALPDHVHGHPRAAVTAVSSPVAAVAISSTSAMATCCVTASRTMTLRLP